MAAKECWDGGGWWRWWRSTGVCALCHQWIANQSASPFSPCTCFNFSVINFNPNQQSLSFTFSLLFRLLNYSSIPLSSLHRSVVVGPNCCCAQLIVPLGAAAACVIEQQSSQHFLDLGSLKSKEDKSATTTTTTSTADAVFVGKRSNWKCHLASSIHSVGALSFSFSLSLGVSPALIVGPLICRSPPPSPPPPGPVCSPLFPFLLFVWRFFLFFVFVLPAIAIATVVLISSLFYIIPMVSEG